MAEYNGWSSEDIAEYIKKIEEQLTQTQQALDKAVEALGEICGRGGYMPTTDFREQTRIMQRIAKAALASISGKGEK